MKAAIFQGKGKVEISKRPDPILVEPNRRDRAGRPGLRVWFGFMVLPGESPFAPGSPIGHEFIA